MTNGKIYEIAELQLLFRRVAIYEAAESWTYHQCILCGWP